MGIIPSFSFVFSSDRQLHNPLSDCLPPVASLCSRVHFCNACVSSTSACPHSFRFGELQVRHQVKRHPQQILSRHHLRPLLVFDFLCIAGRRFCLSGVKCACRAYSDRIGLLSLLNASMPCSKLSRCLRRSIISTSLSVTVRKIACHTVTVAMEIVKKTEHVNGTKRL